MLTISKINYETKFDTIWLSSDTDRDNDKSL